MAIAGLPNVPIHESTIRRESLSSSSGRRRSRGSISTRASSILRMWRELEEECALNRARERGRPRVHREGNDRLSNYGEGEPRGNLEESNESEIESIINSESQMRNLNDQEDSQSCTSEQSQDLGEVERERVRNIFRECIETPIIGHVNRGLRAQGVDGIERERVRGVRDWIQTTNRQREDQVAGIASQIEQACNGQVGINNGSQPENSRRQIRKFIGRQARLDLLAKREQEKLEELQRLKVTRPVSGFAYRNRILALLRYRCLQNRRTSNEQRRPCSAAENELGLLRQRQTVAGLREGFMSRLDNNANVQASDVSDGSSNNDSGTFRDDRSQANCTNEFLDVAHELNNTPPVEVLNVSNEINNSTEEVDVAPSAAPPCVDTHAEVRLECDTNNVLECRPEMGNSNDVFRDMIPQESSTREGRQFTVLEERHEIIHDDYIDREEANVHSEQDDQVAISENINGQELDVPGENWQEQVSDIEREWESNPFSNQWIDDQSQDGNEGEQIGQDDYWHENVSQETPRDWLGIASGSRLDSVRLDTNYFSDDDNMHHIELRELVNRRHVSSLLHSEFRESLDRLIQSYLERQTSAPDDWELDEMLPPFVSNNHQQLLTEDEESGPDDVHENGNEPPLPPLPPPLPQPHWGHGMHQTNRERQETHQRPSTKWEIISDLRIDMARLHQRMITMEKMLETCMSMQIELQRSVRQEVSAALNRSVNPSESLENTPPKDSSKWDSIRKGVCCICSDTNIDSLLYRCGHMCTCTKCADVLLQGNGKCPMCQAPIVEVIRAYFIQ